jgi:hypothetical protein
MIASGSVQNVRGETHSHCADLPGARELTENETLRAVAWTGGLAGALFPKSLD